MLTVGSIFSAIIGGNLKDHLRDALLEIFLWLDGIVYSFISIVYRVFYLVADANLFDFNDPDTIGGITSRIYTVLGVVMLFVFAYNIIILIANPNKLDGDNSLSKIAKNTVISIVLVTLLPTIFNYMHIIQHDVLESNVLGNIILSGSTLSTENGRDSAGTEVALSIFSMFYHPLDRDNGHKAVSFKMCQEDPTITNCDKYNNAWKAALAENDFRYFVHDIDLDEELKKIDKDDPGMEYLFIISTATGILALYMFLSFTIDAGIRVAKLSVLQLVAPIPIILRVTKPTGGIFSKWLDELVSAYISVFVRLAIIFFSMFSIQLLLKADIFPVSLDENGVLIGTAANLVIILGILQFAKDAPGLLEAIAGSKGSKIRLSIKDKINENEYGKRAVSAVGTIGGNLGRMAFNTIASRDANGNKVTGLKNRLANGYHQLLNLPTNVFRGGYEGWKNGNVDFSHGIGAGVSNMRNAVDTSMETTRSVINERQQRRKNTAQRMRNKIKFGVVIPGVSYWADIINENIEMGKEEAEESGGFLDAISDRVNGANNNQVAQSGYHLAAGLKKPMLFLNKDKAKIEAERDRAHSANANAATRRKTAIAEKLASFDDEERHLNAETTTATTMRDKADAEVATYDSRITTLRKIHDEKQAAETNIENIRKGISLKEKRLSEVDSQETVVSSIKSKYDKMIENAGTITDVAQRDLVIKGIEASREAEIKRAEARFASSGGSIVTTESREAVTASINDRYNKMAESVKSIKDPGQRDLMLREIEASRQAELESNDRLARVSSINQRWDSELEQANNITDVEERKTRISEIETARHRELVEENSKTYNSINEEYTRRIEEAKTITDDKQREAVIQNAEAARDYSLKAAGLSQYQVLQDEIAADNRNIEISNATISNKNKEIAEKEQELGTDLQALEARRAAKVDEREKYEASIASMQARLDTISIERAALESSSEDQIKKINDEYKAERERIDKEFGDEIYTRQYDKSKAPEYKQEARRFVNDFKTQFADDIYMIGADRIAKILEELKYNDKGELEWGEDIETIDDLLERYVNPESAKDLKKIEAFIKKLEKIDKHNTFSKPGEFTPFERRRRHHRRPREGGDKK